ncbi:hypothetical protein Sfr7A_07730 [Streptomyces xinghaiensis]|nr:hypothetical protein Sfr7A_07730 [Streptomyces xinghaiensis]
MNGRCPAGRPARGIDNHGCAPCPAAPGGPRRPPGTPLPARAVRPGRRCPRAPARGRWAPRGAGTG